MSILDLANQFHNETYAAHAEESRRKYASGSHWRKHKTRSAGCHPKQVEEFNEKLKRDGVTGAVYLPNGDVEIRSRAGQKSFCKSAGMTNFDDYF